MSKYDSLANPILNVNNIASTKIGFKIGSQNDINAFFTEGQSAPTATEGTFYLTNDSHRLYIGNQYGTVTPVNEGVITVNSIDKLPKTTAVPGQFYYVSGSNILCVCSKAAVINPNTGHVDSEALWVQINNNTSIESITVTSSVENGNGTYILSIKETNSPTARTVTFPFKGANGISFSRDDNGALVATGTKNTNITTTIDSQNSKKAIVAVNDSHNDQVKFNLVAGNNATMAVTQATDEDGPIEDGTITINAIDRSIDQLSFTATNAGFTLTGHKADGSSNIAATLAPTIAYGNNNSASFNSGTATLDVYSKAQIDQKLQTLDALHYMGVVTYAQWLNQNTSNPIYVHIQPEGVGEGLSQEAYLAAVKRKYRCGDVYKLIKGETGTSAGDSITYLPYGTTQTSDRKTITKGSLLIAHGREYTAADVANSNGSLEAADIGYIIPTELSWDIIEESNTDTQFELRAITNNKTVQLYDDIVGTAAHGQVGITTSSANADGRNKLNATLNAEGIFTLSHAGTVTQKDTLVSNQAAAAFATNDSQQTTTINYLRSIQVDDTGHITEYTLGQTNLIDTLPRFSSTNSFSKFGVIDSNDSSFNSTTTPVNDIIFKTSIAMSDSSGTTFNSLQKDVHFASDTLKFVNATTENNGTTTVVDDVVKIDLYWGTF